MPAVLLAAFACVSAHAAETPAAPKPVTTASGVEMVLLPGGTFSMGDNDGEVDEPEHRVTVSPFYIDAHEVTQSEYERVMGENPSKVKGDKNPVEQIRWSDAVRYCNARSRQEGLEPAYDLKNWTCRFDVDGYRLPTEAEWEYACRAGTDSAYSFGDGEAALPQYGWFERNARGKPRPTGTRKPNPWGLHDMHGNLWEWCNDFYQVDYYANSPDTDPRGPASGEKKVLRGGCWNSTPDACRAAYRYNEDPAYTDACFGYDIYGFRCVRSYRGEPAK
ncbi:MAG: formylglycine-generating enzyme family protein [Candidatus Hydrogenedentes bacterium]|nr:formylglycine-generating enzyme family protein [Candidatus Hydrogenedentota bacterium]